MEKLLSKQDLFKAIEQVYNPDNTNIKLKIENEIKTLLSEFWNDYKDYLIQFLDIESIDGESHFYKLRENIQENLVSYIKENYYLDFYDLEEKFEEYQDFERAYFRIKKELNLLSGLLN